METLYYGFAVGGVVAAFAWLCLKRSKQNVKITIDKNTKKSSNIKDHKQQPSMTPASTAQTSTKTVNQKQVEQIPAIKLKKLQQLEQEYNQIFFGSFRLKPSNSVHLITALDFKGSKLLLSTTKNQMVLFNLKGWKKQSKQSSPQKYFVSLDNNGASAVCIGQKYYYAALNFDKTIVYYQFKGEGGIYFKQIGKFARNIFKSNVSAIHVSKAQNYIVTTGSGSDTVIDVWSMKGEKLATTNSFQIQHYGTSCGMKDILIRGWTSEVKIFTTIEQKDGGFKKLDKKQHLTHDESPLAAAICNRDMFALSISKHHRVKIWHLFDALSHRSIQSSPELPQQFSTLNFTKCSLYTSQPLVGHYKTIAILAYQTGVLITDINLKVLHKIEGFQIQNIYMNGTNKSIVLGILTKKSQMLLWNLSKYMELVGEINM